MSTDEIRKELCKTLLAAIKDMHSSDNKKVHTDKELFNESYDTLMNLALKGVDNNYKKLPLVNANMVLTGNTELDHIFRKAINSIVGTAIYKDIKNSNLKYSSFFMGQYRGHNIELSSDKETLYHLLHILNGNNQYSIQVINHSIISSESGAFHIMHLNLDKNTMDTLRPFEFYLNLIEE